MNTNKSREPLLYIQQPDWDFPVSDMQEIYLIRNAEIELIANEINQPQASDNKGNSDQKDSVSAVAIKKKEEKEEEQKYEGIENNESQEIVPGNLIPAVTDEVKSENHSSEKVVESNEAQKVIVQYQEELQEEQINSSSSAKIKHSFSFKRIKSFKEMNTAEKVDYLANFPKLLPPVPCIFITSNSSIRGFLMSKSDEDIEVKTFDEKMIQIHINELIEIKIIGFK